MPEIYLKHAHTFPVPVTVADHLLGLASHDQLKVLLYLLCHADQPLTAEQIVRACKVQPAAVEEAIVFWQNVNVLQQEASVPAVALTQTAAPPPKPETALPPMPASAVQSPRADSSRFSLNPSEIAERMQSNAAIAEMFRAVEQYAARPLTHTELQSMIWMHEYLGVQPDLIMMLAAFCIQSGCFQVRYMERVALEWHERGVRTHTQAEADIRRITESRSFTGKIMRLFEMDRHPTKKQQALIDTWQAENIPLELIELAYEKTRDNLGDKLSLSYLNKILKQWQAAGIRTAADAEREDTAYYAAKKQNRTAGKPSVTAAAAGKDSSIDMDEVEKLINQF